MQIDRYNHLLFPRDHASSATANGAASGVDASGGARPRASVPGAAASDIGTARAESMVLKIQWPDAVARGVAEAVYTVDRKGEAPLDSDADSQAQAHQRAVERNAGVFTQLTVNKDGVLVARPQAATESKQPDFVALAVSAMREFSDEAERQKAAQPPVAEQASPATGWGRLKDLQQFAARFKVFA